MGFLKSDLSPEKAAALVAKIEEKLIADTKGLEDAKALIGITSLAALNGGQKESAEATKARANRQKMADVLEETEETLKAAKKQWADALQKHENARIAQAWKETRKRASVHREKSKKLQDLLVSAGQLAEEIKQDGVEIYNTCPQKDASFIDTNLNPTRVQYALENYLFKVRLISQKHGMFMPHELPDIAALLGDACDWALKFDKNKDLSETSRPYTKEELAELTNV